MILDSNLIKDIKEQPEDKKTVIDFSSNPHLNNDVFKSKIGLLNAMSDDEIFALLNVCYPSILEDINSNKFEYVKAYINPRFINQFARIIATTEISLSKKKACCRLAYLYHIAKSANKNEVIEKLYTILAKFSCRDIVPILCGKGIPEKMSIDLAIARYSSDNETINVRRVNFVIQNGPIDIINTQHIVWIYEVLFDRVTPLFKGTMFDVLDEDEEWVTDDILDIDSMISLAVLEILNNMTLDQIRQVLLDYTGDYESIVKGNNNKSKFRFSVVALSGDYSRVVTVAEGLREEGYNVP